MGLKINLDNRTEFVPNLIATSKVQLDCQDPVAIAPGSDFALSKGSIGLGAKSLMFQLTWRDC